MLELQTYLRFLQCFFSILTVAIFYLQHCDFLEVLPENNKTCALYRTFEEYTGFTTSWFFMSVTLNLRGILRTFGIL